MSRVPPKPPADRGIHQRREFASRGYAGTPEDRRVPGCDGMGAGMGAADANAAAQTHSGRGRIRGLLLEALFLIAAALVVLDQVVVDPKVGLADNGDFARIMLPLGIVHVTADDRLRYFNFAAGRLGWTHRRKWTGFVSSEMLLVAPASAAVRALSGGHLFSITTMGLIHAIIFLAALAVGAWALRRVSAALRVLIYALAIFVFCDVGYIAYFNSLHCEAAGFVFLVSAIALALAAAHRTSSWRGQSWCAAGFFVTSSLVATAKPQYAVLGFPLAFAGYRLTRSSCGRQVMGRRGVGIAAALMVAVLSLWYGACSVPRNMAAANIYNMLFYDILPNSPAPEQDLAAMGLDQRLLGLIGTTAFSPGNPLNDRRFKAYLLANAGYGKVMRFYLARPRRLGDLFRRASAHAFSLRPRLGNFERRAGLPPRSIATAFSTWSTLKERWMPKSWSFVLAFFVFSAAVLAVKYSRFDHTASQKAMSELQALLAAMAALQFVVVPLAEGEVDITKHYLLFNALFDACLMFFAAYAAAAGFRLLGKRGLS